eukprot:GEMP01052997.1.p1 GENE.GEMP01052997.1~~GEMP01052997.1.p1  ORF type:complete len:151 (+),score=44.33 GEMP01052997.1:1-453(+)
MPTPKSGIPTSKSKTSSKATIPPKPDLSARTTATLEDPVIQHTTPSKSGVAARHTTASKSDLTSQAKKVASKRTRDQRLLQWQLDTQQREAEFEEWQQRQKRRVEQELQWLGIGPSSAAPVVAEAKIEKEKAGQSAPYDDVLRAFFDSLS